MSASHRPQPSQPSSSGALRGSMRAIIPHPFGGTIIMTGFPGLETSYDGSATFMPEACRETLEGIRAQGAGGLFVMVERDELDPLGFDLLERTATAVGLTIAYYPIVDYSVPSEALERVWAAQRPAREAALRAGGNLAFSCQYGAGRSGLMTCWTLMEAGLSASDAIALVRSHFSQAVESDEQERWLAALRLTDDC